MKIPFSKSELKKISKQLNTEFIPVDELEEFCLTHHHCPKNVLEKMIWKKFGLFKNFSGPKVITFFTTKGGVLKTTLAQNVARMAAINGLKTLAIGLDMQCDITNCLLANQEDDDSIESALEKIDQRKGLYEFFNKKIELEEIILETDLEQLFIIPESPNLTLLNDAISLIHRREFWLKEKIINPLINSYDLIILDCSPNWNRLTTNALCATDLLISPLECKINNFKNYEVFKELVGQIKDDLFLQFKSFFVPTRFSKNKKLSCDILHWYQENIENCSKFYIAESIESEEAVALQKSVVEYRPMSKSAKDLKHIIDELVNLISHSEITFMQHHKLNQGFNSYGVNSQIN